MAQNELFPIFLKLNTLDVLLVGGGNVGLEKISAMLQNSPEARITVVAPMILDSLREYIRHFEQVQIIEREFQEQDLDNRDLVILATDNPQLHATIKATTKQRRILCNVADTPHLCDFYLGSIVQKGDLKIAISTNGKSPTMAKRIREFLDDIIPDNIQNLLDNLREIRKSIQGDFQEKIRVLNEVTASLVEKKK
ncbi:MULTISPECIES: precorrin-2 dehydrogenase/sirohydrochlorin ferrochelatase family protein [Flectobacillus]|uniref:precorrin-2 dehydrogenase n=1 Tax=Flectobacillus roseus TaxID=502259 RepID=A0ABT6YB65_9BACT|nr:MULTISPECIES: bifunctional precorrin-2 dehydrogenase/sirohydrochlorin ferrochelatase [Flectobacillus]MDI9860811.1 bifunctional precorrin-2 dehydrogenase/sirohydrochlorin ferrochelatase [Flectobacillus roseus]NBA76021.1 bifunctional precorrin-2 dehydrogenase/sirohydrochlorin ferrochelatase [Emticicia sp. ODNR4P]PAC32875.1 siroheme synthase [Flectobacillus sp. BAB-3569]